MLSSKPPPAEPDPREFDLDGWIRDLPSVPPPPPLPEELREGTEE